MTETTARLNWKHEPEASSAALAGYAGTFGQDLFRIYAPDESDDRWILASLLPGADHRSGYGASAEELMPVAERLLEEFVTSLGAAFPVEGAGNEAGQDEAGQPAPPAKRPVLTSMYVFDVLYSAGFTPWGNGEPGFTTGWYMDAITVDHAGADLPVHGPLEGPRSIIADYAQTLFAAGFDTHITVNTVFVRKRTTANPAPAGEKE